MTRQINPRSVNPFTPLPNQLIGKIEGYEWAVMFALRYHGCECYPSHARISEIAGVSIKTTKRTLESLREKDLVSWEERYGEDGNQTSNLYTLHIDDLWNEVGPPAPPPGLRDLPPGLRDLPPRSVRPTPQACEAYEQDLPEQDLLELLEPPIPPAQPKAVSAKSAQRQLEERVKERALLLYQGHKPPNWIDKQTVSSASLALLMHWVEDLGEEEFYLVFEKALKRCCMKSFWKDNHHKFETLVRKTKTHLTELAEEYDQLGSKTGIATSVTLSDEDIQRKLRGEF